MSAKVEGLPGILRGVEEDGHEINAGKHGCQQPRRVPPEPLCCSVLEHDLGAHECPCDSQEFIHNLQEDLQPGAHRCLFRPSDL